MRQEAWSAKQERLSSALRLITEKKATPNELENKGIIINKDGKYRTAFDLLRYPNLGWKEVLIVWPDLSVIDVDIREQIEIDAIYSGYMSRQDADIEAFRRDENLIIPEAIDYKDIGSLSNEVIQKLEIARPETLGAASRIPGVTPSAIMSLLRVVKQDVRRKNAA